MVIDRGDKNRIQQLSEKRARIADEKRRAEKRADYGAKVVEKINAALGTQLTLDSFHVNDELPTEFVRKPNLADCPGLLVAHVSERRIREITECCDATLGKLNGTLGFDEYGFVGVAQVSSTTLLQLAGAAKALHDSVLFCPVGSESIVLIDHYRVSGMQRDVGFSVVVQGATLEERLAPCFENLVKLKAPTR